MSVGGSKSAAATDSRQAAHSKKTPLALANAQLIRVHVWAATAPPCSGPALCSSTARTMATANGSAAPSAATDAVLKPSEPVPAGSREVQGIDFNRYATRSITVQELVGGYANMGFQATSVGEAVRIISDMVSSLANHRNHSPGACASAGVRRRRWVRKISVRPSPESAKHLA